MHIGIRLLRLAFGLFLFSLGLVLVMRGNLGYGPWELFQAGLTNYMPITIGQATVLVSVMIVVLVFLLKETIGLGTLANMSLIGIFMDFILAIDIIPLATRSISGICMLIVGLFVVALGSYYYISSGFGAGPRDSLMVAIRRYTGLSIGVSRGILECSVAILGWLLGGPLGLGTVITAFGLGYCIQIIFKVFSFESTNVKHESLLETLHVHSKRKAK